MFLPTFSQVGTQMGQENDFSSFFPLLNMLASCTKKQRKSSPKVQSCLLFSIENSHGKLLDNFLKKGRFLMLKINLNNILNFLILKTKGSFVYIFGEDFTFSAYFWKFSIVLFFMWKSILYLDEYVYV